MKLDVFIKGELIDLCIPTLEFVKQSQWYNWFNNPKTNRFLEQGAFPNTIEDEIDFFERERRNRLILIITDKNQDELGVISLSFINFNKKTADIALVLSEKQRERLAALEAMARVTEHAFTTMGLLKISAGQHKDLFKWQNLLELIGYKVEGIFEKGFIKGGERVNAVHISSNIEDYKKIVANRGSLWDSNEKMLKRKANLPGPQFVTLLNEYFDTVRKDYYDRVFAL